MEPKEGLRTTVSCTRLFEFEACHHLEGYDGDCSRMHGHTYKLEVTVGVTFEMTSRCVQSKIINQPGSMVMDFKVLDKMVKDHIVSEVDHRNLDDVFLAGPTTAENMVCTIAHTLDELMPHNISLIKVVLWETSKSCATWERE